MRSHHVPAPLRDQSTFDLTLRRSKVLILQARRLALWARSPQEFPVAAHGSQLERQLLHQVSVSANSQQSHPRLEEGKIRNLRIAAAHFDGRVLSPSQGFSFWRLLGRPSRGRGFLPGTEVRDGCVVPSMGGGLCLLSGLLFRLAAELGWTIVERHGHTIAPQNFEQIDATVFWPFVDLRFAPVRGSVLLRVSLQGDQLRVAAYGEAGQSRSRSRVWRKARDGDTAKRRLSVIVRSREDERVEELGVDSQEVLSHGLRRNCLTCNETECQSRKSFLEVL